MNDQNPNNGNNPKWKPFLDVLPDSLHSLVIPILKDWDAGVTKQFQEIHKQYEDLKPFKEFVDNGIEVDYIKNAVVFADQVQNDPRKVFEQVNQTWELGFVSPEQAAALNQNNSTDNNDEFDLGDNDNVDDLLKNPKFKEVYDGLLKIQQEQDERRQQEEQDQALASFEAELNALETATTEKNLPFNRMFVTALMSQGVKGEDAVNQYHQVLAVNSSTDENNSQQTSTDSSTEQPPVVMGGNGVTGSGTPDGSVNFGSMSKNDLNAAVEEMIRQAAESNQG